MKKISTLIFLMGSLGMYGQEIVVRAICQPPRIVLTCKPFRTICSEVTAQRITPQKFSTSSFQPVKDLSNPFGKKISGKVTGLTVYNSDKSDSNKSGSRIYFRCNGRRNMPDDNLALIVVDGKTVPVNTLNYMNPNDVESVRILKGGQAQALFGYAGRNGALLITTKNSKVRKFIIKDYLDKSNISGATVTFISADKKDTAMYVANDLGIVINNKLEPGEDFEVIISAVGYKPYKAFIQRIPDRISDFTFFLDRNIKINDEIFLVTQPLRRRGCPRGYGQAVSKKIIKEDSLTEKSVKIYSQLKIFPNPVPKGGILNITTPRGREGLIYHLFSPSGRLLRSGTLNPLKDFNQISLDSRWSSGVYLLQVYENGCVLASGKVITQ